jgi:hypothetical protein
MTFWMGMLGAGEEMDQIDLDVVAERFARQDDRRGKRRGGQGEMAATDSAGHRDLRATRKGPQPM